MQIFTIVMTQSIMTHRYDDTIIVFHINIYISNYSPNSRFSEAAWSARGRNLNENLLVSMWVYLDDQDTSRNIIYVS